MQRSERSTKSCGMSLVVIFAGLIVMIPIVGIFLLPQFDIPGRICWAIRQGTMNREMLLMPNDDFTTGTLASVFVFFNIAVIVLTILGFGARSRARSGAKIHPGRYWAALAGMLAIYIILVALAADTWAKVEPNGFVTKEFCSRPKLHPWNTISKIERIRMILPSSRGSGNDYEYERKSTEMWFQYWVVFRDGSKWQSATSRNWSWPIVKNAMKHASKLSHAPIQRYRFLI